MADIPDFVVPVRKVVETTEAVALNMWQLCLEEGDADTPFRVTVILRAKDAATLKWRTDIDTIKIVFEDDPKAHNPLDMFKGTTFYNLILDCLIPTDNPLAQALGIAGQPLRLAGRTIIAGQLGG